MILTILPIRAICSAFFLLPGASTRSTASFRTAVFLILYAWIAGKSAVTMQTSECGNHCVSLSSTERLTFYSENNEVVVFFTGGWQWFTPWLKAWELLRSKEFDVMKDYIDKISYS